MNCSACQHSNPDDSAFCEECGAALEASCPACGAASSPGAKFCRRCGSGMNAAARPPASAPSEPRSPRDYTPGHLAEKILQSKSALEGERKQVTVLFADVKGSMELAEGLDPEAWHRILDRFFQILTEGVHRFEGTVNQYTGDGIMALFGAPIAHEDHAHRACFAALHLRDAVSEYANEVRLQYGIPFGVRVGLNSGEVVVGKIGDDLRMDYTAQGHVVGLAQRMEALAESSHICVSGQTQGLIEGYFELKDLGPTQVKGVATPVEVYDLEGVGPFRTRLDRSRSRGLSSFVGRDEEMSTLDTALENALAGRGRIVGVVADAGVGKSRLCFEFIQKCRARGVIVHEAHCPAHGSMVPHLPIIELLRSYFGVAEGDSARAVREKVAGRLLLLDRSFEDSLPLVWELLRVPDPDQPPPETDPSLRKRQLHEFVRRLVRARSEQEPAVLLLDDLHWIDPASDEIVAELVDAVRGTRTLLLVNFRPEYRAEWTQHSNYQQQPLTPLHRDAILALLRTLLGVHPSVAELPEAIEARTSGNPFFSEEVVNGLIESGQLEGVAGAYHLTGSVAHIDIPPNVQAVLAARIDRLSEARKRVLQTAAIIGRNFAEPLLARIAGPSAGDLEEALRELCELDFLFERSLYPVAEYAFKHPLTHEVAYGSQLRERRAEVHGVLARAFEASGESSSLLAHHWDESGDAEPAAHWHSIAAAEAGLASAPAAARHWERTHELLQSLPETPARLTLAAKALGQLLWMGFRQGMPPERGRELYDEAIRLAERAGDRASVARTRTSYGMFTLLHGQTEAKELTRAARDDAERFGDLETRASAHFGVGGEAHFRESYQLAEAEMRICAELCGEDLGVGKELMGYSVGLFARVMLGAACIFQGRVAEGLAHADRGLIDHGPPHRLVQALAGSYLLPALAIVGDHHEALERGRWCLETLQEVGSPAGNFAIAYLGLGQALALTPQLDEARAALDRSMELQREANSFFILSASVEIARAGLSLDEGDTERAAIELERGRGLVERMQLASRRVEVHLLKARLQRLQGASPSAVETALGLGLSAIHEVQAFGIVPQIHLERAALLEREGDASGRRVELERARDLYTEMAAPGSAERVARLLRSTSSTRP